VPSGSSTSSEQSAFGASLVPRQTSVDRLYCSSVNRAASRPAFDVFAARVSASNRARRALVDVARACEVVERRELRLELGLGVGLLADGEHGRAGVRRVAAERDLVELRA
jgi:hypothetical protein